MDLVEDMQKRLDESVLNSIYLVISRNSSLNSQDVQVLNWCSGCDGGGGSALVVVK